MRLGSVGSELEEEGPGKTDAQSKDLVEGWTALRGRVAEHSEGRECPKYLTTDPAPPELERAGWAKCEH